MLIREVILENFMSYEYARVQLKPGVNIVCGPNGSGKSSFLLGISVALGETYTERSKRLSDLIRWGQDVARISLILDNSEKSGIRPIPQFDTDMIRLTRNIRRDGKYWFELNQKSAQKYEVIQILKALGFDSTNMLIVMHQNMAELFANVSPQEKLKILESAVGFESLRSDVVEARKKLRGVLSEEESLNQLLERSRETLNYWKEQYDRLEEKKQLQTRSIFIQQELAWSRVLEFESILMTFEQDLDSANRDLDSARLEMEKYGKTIINAENEARKYRRDFLDLLEERIKFERTLGICDYAISSSKDYIHQVDGMLDSYKERLKIFKLGTEDLRAKLKSGPTTLDDYFRILAEIEEAQTEAYEEWYSELSSQKTQAEKQISNLSERFKDAESRVNEVTQELQLVRERMDEINDIYIEGRIQLALLNDRKDRLRKKVDELSLDIERCKIDLRDAESEAILRGSRIETGRHPEEILGDLRKVSGILLALADVSDEADAMYESYSKTFKELQERVEQIRQSRREVMEEIEVRTRRWLKVTQELLDQINERYKILLTQLQANGEVRLINAYDIEEAGLDIYVGFKGAHQSRLDPYTHSGGERSTSVMAFLLALQQNIMSPFRAVDEFDLHMDPKNREIVSEFIVSTLEGTKDQYLAITPSQVSFRGKDVHLIMVHKTEETSKVRIMRQNEQSK